jgi:hypothetical protein
MSDTFQRLLTMSGPEVQSLNAQASLGEPVEPERSQFAHLVRHFLARFFNHETASPDGDAKTRLVQIAFVVGIPPLLVAMYLWPIYHPVIADMMQHQAPPGPPPYWVQVNHHFFFVIYSFAVVGIATVFEWDLFFPDLIDLFVLTTLPIPARRLFSARVAAIAILVAGFLIDTGGLAPLVMPAATDPPNMPRLVIAHIASVLAAGLFASALVLGAQSVVLALFGERIFRRVALFAQGIAVTVFTVLLLIFPVFSGFTADLLKSGGKYVLFFPPYWFLGIYQRILEGPSAQPVIVSLARMGVFALLIAVTLVIVAYPIAYLRRTRQLLVGANTRSLQSRFFNFLLAPLIAALARTPGGRAVFHFIGQTMLRVPRYRIYLVLYGGVGLSFVAVIVLRLQVSHQQLHFSIDPDGLRASIGLIAYWIVSGLRTSFISAGNRQGAWIWRIIQGEPPVYSTALERAAAAKRWAMAASLAVTLAMLGLLHIYAPLEVKTGLSTAAQIAAAVACCVLLTDFIFLHCETVPFTGTPARQQSNLALTVLGYFTLLPLIMALSCGCEIWMERDIRNIGVAVVIAAVVHIWLRKLSHDHLRLCSNDPAIDEDDDQTFLSLGLRS